MGLEKGTDPTTVVVPDGVTGTDIDGFELPTSKIEGIIYEDANGNGTQDPGELVFQGSDVGSTDSNGEYSASIQSTFPQDLPLPILSTVRCPMVLSKLEVPI